MPQFEYKARDAGGAIVIGALEGSTQDAIATQLLNTGMTPVKIEEKQESTDQLKAIKKLLVRKRAPDLSEMVMFCRQMYSLLRTGVPINQSLNGIMRSLKNEYFKEVLGEISHTLETGQDLSTSVSKYPRVFSPLFIAMIKIGENTGRLDEAFLQISQYMERDKETRNRIKSALRYPSFVLIAISIAIAVINIMVVPAFAKIFENANTELPIPTQILMMTSNIFVNYWGVLLAVIIITAGGFKQWANSEVGAYHWDRIKLKLPLVGDIINRAILGRFARSFAMTLSAGVPLTQALNVVSKAVDNEFIRARVLEIRSAVEQGDSLTRAAVATGMFTPLVIQMLNVGEESGSVDDMMEEVADFYEREVDYDVKNLSSTIEPVMITVIGAMVLLLALGIFLPMWDMSSVALGG